MLTRIAINSALVTIRKRCARPETSFEQPPSLEDGGSRLDVQDSALNPGEIGDQKHRSRAVLYAIERLDPKLRTPLRSEMSDEWSMRRLAQHLGFSLASVKARLHRARSYLIRSEAAQNRELELIPIDRFALCASTPESLHSSRDAHAALRSSIPKYSSFSESQSHQCESLDVG